MGVGAKKPYNTKIDWTEVDPLMIAGELQYKEIAARFDISRNTIIAHARLLGLVKRTKKATHDWNTIDPLLAKIKPHLKHEGVAALCKQFPTVPPKTMGGRYYDVRRGRHLSRAGNPLETADHNPRFSTPVETIKERNRKILQKRMGLMDDQFQAWQRGQGPFSAFSHGRGRRYDTNRS